MIGRPSILTDELTESICTRMAEGESLRAICRSEGMPAMGTVFRWVSSNLLFREQYEAAMAQRTESMFEEILEIADETDRDTLYTENGERPNAEWISRSRLRVDARKWMLSKMLPKKYGERLAIGGHEDMPPLQTEATLNVAGLSTAALAELMALKDATKSS
jgi:acyl-homoserine lactone acylase PvdQ